MVRICLLCGEHGFNPWVRKIPWRRAWQPTPVSLPGDAHGQRSLAGYCSSGCKEWDTVEWLIVSLSHGCMSLEKKNECMLRMGNFIRYKLNLNGIYFFDRPTRFRLFCCWLGLSQFNISLCWKAIDFLNYWIFPRLMSWQSNFHFALQICDLHFLFLDGVVYWLEILKLSAVKFPSVFAWYLGGSFKKSFPVPRWHSVNTKMSKKVWIRETYFYMWR